MIRWWLWIRMFLSIFRVFYNFSRFSGRLTSSILGDSSHRSGFRLCHAILILKTNFYLQTRSNSRGKSNKKRSKVFHLSKIGWREACLRRSIDEFLAGFGFTWRIHGFLVADAASMGAASVATVALRLWWRTIGWIWGISGRSRWRVLWLMGWGLLVGVHVHGRSGFIVNVVVWGAGAVSWKCWRGIS